MDKSLRVLDFVEDIPLLLLGRIKSPFISFPCVYRIVPNNWGTYEKRTVSLLEIFRDGFNRTLSIDGLKTCYFLYR